MTDSPFLSEDEVAALIARTGRSCGSCSLCCKVLPIDVPELVKPEGQWCPYCRPGRGGCSIYGARPRICRTFACRWLTDSSIGEAWFPARSRMVLVSTAHDGVWWLLITADPSVPNAWQRAPYHADLQDWAAKGLSDPEHPTAITIAAGPRQWWILPGATIKVPGDNTLSFLTPWFKQARAETLASGTYAETLKRLQLLGSFAARENAP